MHHVVEMLKILLIILKLSDTFVNVCHWIEMGTIISLTKSTNTLSDVLHYYYSAIGYCRLFGYIEDRLENELPVDGERLNGFVCLMQSILLGSFAAILAAHRSEILDQKISVEDDDGAYEAPQRPVV